MVELLKSIPPTAYVALFTAIVTASVTLLGVYLTNLGNTRRLNLQLQHEELLKEKQSQRERLEELYMLAAKYSLGLTGMYLPYFSAVDGKIQLGDANRMVVESLDKESFDFPRLQMLIDIYFPETLPAYLNLMHARDETQKVWNACEKHLEHHQLPDSDMKSSLRKTYSTIKPAADALKKEIIKQAQAA
jgi:hypothetical protein